MPELNEIPGMSLDYVGASLKQCEERLSDAQQEISEKENESAYLFGVVEKLNKRDNNMYIETTHLKL